MAMPIHFVSNSIITTLPIALGMLSVRDVVYRNLSVYLCYNAVECLILGIGGLTRMHI